MKKRSVILLMLLVFCFSLTSCGPSDEKVAQAQAKYGELSDAHDAVVEAHKLIADTSYDETLTTLRKEAIALNNYNLEEMKDEEIDTLIQTMDSMIGTYDEYLNALTEIKAQEDAAVLVTIPVTLTNNTSFSFSELSLYEQGDTTAAANMLANLTPLAPSQTLTGLFIQRDVDNTPWGFVLTDTEGAKWELPLSVEDYTEEGISLALTYDSETETLSIGTNVSIQEENS